VAGISQVKWQFHTAGQILSSPVVAGNTVLFWQQRITMSMHSISRWALKNGNSNGRPRSFHSCSRKRGVFFLSYDANFLRGRRSSGALKWKFAREEATLRAKHLTAWTGRETLPDPFDFFLSRQRCRRNRIFRIERYKGVRAGAASGALKWKFQDRRCRTFFSSWSRWNSIYRIGIPIFTLWMLRPAEEKWRFKTGEDHETYNQVGIQGSTAVAGESSISVPRFQLYAVDAEQR